MRLGYAMRGLCMKLSSFIAWAARTWSSAPEYGSNSKTKPAGAGVRSTRSFLTIRQRRVLSLRSSISTSKGPGGNSSIYMSPCSRLRCQGINFGSSKSFTGLIWQRLGQRLFGSCRH